MLPFFVSFFFFFFLFLFLLFRGTRRHGEGGKAGRGRGDIGYVGGYAYAYMCWTKGVIPLRWQ